jgi:hypothetical protein
VLLVLVGVGLKELAQAVLPGEAAGVVGVVLHLLVGLVILVLLEGLIDNRRRRDASGRATSRAVREAPAVPRPPRSWPALLFGAVVGLPFAAGMALAGSAFLVGWPWDWAVPEGESRWFVGLGGPIMAALIVHEFVRGVREEPGSRASLAAIVEGRAARHPATVSRRGLADLTLTLQGCGAPLTVVSVTVTGGGLRARGWKPFPGDEAVIAGELRKREPVLVTTADGSRWFCIESLEQAMKPPSAAPPA